MPAGTRRPTLRLQPTHRAVEGTTTESIDVDALIRASDYPSWNEYRDAVDGAPEYIEDEDPPGGGGREDPPGGGGRAPGGVLKKGPELRRSNSAALIREWREQVGTHDLLGWPCPGAALVLP